jgi:hypothetical protein
VGWYKWHHRDDSGACIGAICRGWLREIRQLADGSSTVDWLGWLKMRKFAPFSGLPTAVVGLGDGWL